MPLLSLAYKSAQEKIEKKQLTSAGVIMKVGSNLPLRMPQMTMRCRSTLIHSSADDGKPLPPLLHLARQRKFDVIAIALAERSEAEIFPWIDDCSPSQDEAGGVQTFKGETMLHLIMSYQPSLEVVNLLILRMTDKRPETVPEAATDMLSRTPLHVAVAHGCEHAVIDRLLNGTVTVVPAVTKDAQQRLPLHWACCSTKTKGATRDVWWRVNCGARASDSENSTRIIEALVKAYPHAVTVKDRSGLTPLDLATANNAHPYILRLLDDHVASKSPSGVELSNSGTDETFEADIPFEIGDFYNGFQCGSHFDHDDDDISSIGVGGLSSYRWHGKKKPALANSKLPHIREQFDI